MDFQLPYPTQTLTPVVVWSPELTRGFVRTVPVCACSCVQPPPQRRLNFNITLTQAARRLHRLHRFVCHSLHRPLLPLPRSTPHLSFVSHQEPRCRRFLDHRHPIVSIIQTNNVHDASPVEPSIGAARRWRSRTLDLVSPFPFSYVFTILFT